jgi:1-acyl-sn-glycerol-3-phosphate acyltransferase
MFVDNGEAVLAIANHISWWDGFWVEYLNQKIIHRKFYFMMLEEQLIKRWYFRYSGGYSIKQKSRSVIESINYSIELLKQPENLLLMFPQGKIHSMHYNEVINFGKGVERVIKNIPPETQILFVVNIVDYFSNFKPNLYIYFNLFLAKDFLSTSLESKYNEFYKMIFNTHKTKVS